MPSTCNAKLPDLGIIGFGAFGRLMAHHLRPYFRIHAHDAVKSSGHNLDQEIADLATAAGCPIVIFATPVISLEDAIAAAASYLKLGALILDVGSVKVLPVEIMRRCLPDHVDIVATHPLFGPQSARDGVAGLKIAVCPVRGDRDRRVAAFLRRALRLRVILTTPDDHDREAATVQGLTHLIAKVLVQMEPLPTRLTTRSFELLMEGVSMVRDDASAVFQAIERSNPYSQEVRRRFFDLANALDVELASTHAITPPSGAPCPGAPCPGASCPGARPGLDDRTPNRLATKNGNPPP